MIDIIVLFSTDLYDSNKHILNKYVLLVEDHIYFDRSSVKLGCLKFNILKPIYHRATMMSYYDKLKRKNINCTYIDLNTNWVSIVKSYTKSKLYFFNPVDHILENKIKCNFKDYILLDTPRFLLTNSDLSQYNGPIRQTSFYIWMRKKFNILMQDNKPIGNKMTYDVENRNPPYKNMVDDMPTEPNFSTNKYVIEAEIYVKKNIKQSHLFIPEQIILKFPIDSRCSKIRLFDFIKNYLNKFGTYQDIILQDPDNSLVYHSGLSPMLNIGLITPLFVIEQILKHPIKELHNIEGFIRQILGWREFSRYFYTLKYDIKNYFNSENVLTNKWYIGTVGVEPVDVCIKKAFKFGYLHHIERLMVVANYMTISKINPTQIYKWFMEFAIDSYDWVMIFNIYAMVSYSDRGPTTKPYISSSNYIIKMSNYNKQSDWTSLWDLLFWKFLNLHKTKIKKIPRLAYLIKHIQNHI